MIWNNSWTKAGECSLSSFSQKAWCLHSQVNNLSPLMPMTVAAKARDLSLQEKRAAGHCVT
jgi:hypothetical protein